MLKPTLALLFFMLALPAFCEEEADATAQILNSAKYPLDETQFIDYVMANQLLESQDRDGNTPIFIAALNNQATALKTLISKGANINHMDIRGNTLLNYAHTLRRPIVDTLINLGADIEHSGERGATPLLAAAAANSTEMAKVFISRGANINAQQDDGQTALIFACSHKNTELIHFLVSMGADVNLGKGLLTPLQVSLSKRDTATTTFLMKHGAKR